MKLIVSSLPGRMRIRNVKLRGDPLRLNELEQALRAFDPECSITPNATSGSLLVQYDHERISQKVLAQAVDQAARAVFGLETRTRKQHYTPASLRLNRYAKYGMFTSLGLTLWFAAVRAKRPHAAAGVLFVACLGIHLAVHRHRLLS